MAGGRTTINSAPSRPAEDPRRRPEGRAACPSVSSCRINRQRLAPSERRTAISFWRTAARASNRFATFAQAINSTRPTIVINRPPAITTFPRNPGLIVACASGTTVIFRPPFSLGYSLASWLAIVLRFASACCTLTPGFSRPVALKTKPRRLSGRINSRTNPAVVCS